MQREESTSEHAMRTVITSIVAMAAAAATEFPAYVPPILTVSQFILTNKILTYEHSIE